MLKHLCPFHPTRNGFNTMQHNGVAVKEFPKNAKTLDFVKEGRVCHI
jgi:hypothetical protein